MPPGARKNIFIVGDMETFVGQKSSVEALRGKTSDEPLEESDLEDTNQYRNLDEDKDGIADAKDGELLYSNFF